MADVTLETDAATGARARSELAQTETAFATIRAMMVEQIIAELPTAEGRAKIDRLICSCQVLDAVKNMLMQTVAQGQVAEHQIALIQQGLIEPT